MVWALDAARRLKAKDSRRDRGEFTEQSRIKFRAYAGEWIERYQGNGRRGFTETTREDYRSAENDRSPPLRRDTNSDSVARATDRDRREQP